jgi:hypothetical protein
MNTIAFFFTLFLPETKDLSLERMDVVFNVVDEDKRCQDVEKHLTSMTKKEDNNSVTTTPVTGLTQ